MFIHLRLHSSYSLAEGAIRIEEIPNLCIKNNMPAVGITDTNNLFGALEIATLCKKKGIQALTGIQINLKTDHNIAPLLFFSTNETGYQNLLKLTSLLYAPGKDLETPSIVFDDFKKYKDGLICLTGGHEGPIGKLILDDKRDEAKKLLLELHKCFKNNLYIEIQRHGLEDETITEPYFIDFAHKENIPLVATNNVFFDTPEMYEAHDALLCIAQGTYVVEDGRRRVTEHHYFKSSQEMEDLFSDLPEATQNTVNIARRIHFIPLPHPPILPRFSTENGKSEIDELRHKSYEGLNIRLKEEVFPRDKINEADQDAVFQKYKDRLEYELGIIEKMGFPGYFLIVADFIQWAKTKNIPVGPGRGSGAGSLVAWVTTITDMDPIYFGLIFERFLNPERVSMPDFDVDFCQDRRDEVIKYVAEKYGIDQVAHIITFGKLQPRAVLRDVGRVLQIPYGKIGGICNLIPNNPANPVTLKQAIEMDEKLKRAVEEDAATAKLFVLGQQLEGLNRHASTHAAGIVIGDRPLNELVPLYRDEKSHLPITQFNMKYVENAGLVKFDFLGLKTLSVIDSACQMIKKHHKPDFKIQTISLADQKTFDLLSRIETVGIFQLESAGMKDVIKKLRPDQFEDIIALVALYRPGPMDDIPRYVACKHGEEKVHYLHPLLEPILSPTYGVMVYQEQVMHIAQVLGGYSLGSADLLRRAMGKKIKSEMDAQRDLFIKGAIKNGIDQKTSSLIFDQMAKFAGYGFNKSHSAPYALLAYQTAFLKANYPLEFFSASMTYDIHNTEKLNIFRQDIINLGFDVLPPDINHSHATFWVDHNNKAVRYALGAIKNVGIGVVDLLVQERITNGDFKSLDDFVKRIDIKVLNKRLLESLIVSGAFDCLHKNRQQLYKSIDALIKQSQSYTYEKQNKQASLFAAPKTKSGTQILLAKCDDFAPLDALEHEFSSLGYYLSAHPLDIYKYLLPTLNVIPAFNLEEKATLSGVAVNLAGVLLSKQEKTSKAGNKFAFVKFSDSANIFESALFSEKYINLRELLKEGQSFLIEATLKLDAETNDLKIMINNLTPLDQFKKGQDLYLPMTSEKHLETIIKIINELPKGNMNLIFQIRTKNERTVQIKLKRRLDIDQKSRTHLLSLVTI